MRHRHVIGITAVAVDAERVRLHRTHVLVICKTARAFAAAEPGIGQRDGADLEPTFVGVLHVRPEGDDLARRLVAHGAWQGYAAVLQRQRLPAMTKLIAAFPDVQVAVADTGRLHLDQHLRARGLRCRVIDFLQRCIEIGNLKALHGVTPACFLAFPRLFNVRTDQG